MKFERSNEYFRNMVNTSLRTTGACMMVLDVEKMQYVYIANSESIFGMSPEDMYKEIKGYNHLPVREYAREISRYFTHPDDWSARGDAFARALNGEETSYEARLKSSATDYKWCKVVLLPYFENGRLRDVIAFCFDINELKLANEKINQIKGLDIFTGGFNKRGLFKRTKGYLKENAKGKHAFILIDIDDFKDINDTYGHYYGDLVLLGIARFLDSISEKRGGYFGRFGGDEFIVFIPNYESIDLKKMLKKLTEYEVAGIRATASVGVALFPRDGKNEKELFVMSDIALYNSKGKGKACYSFYHDMGIVLFRDKGSRT